MVNYIAVVHKELDTDFGVSFPDFLGCITAGKNVDEARDDAERINAEAKKRGTTVIAEPLDFIWYLGRELNSYSQFGRGILSP